MSSNTLIHWQQPTIIHYSQILYRSFQHWTGKSLIERIDDPLLLSESLFKAPFVIVSHGTQADPIFNYGNLKALELWQMDWDDFTSLPSRYSAEPIERSERETMLTKTQTQGFFSNFRGVRISSKGDRFFIEDGIIWNLLDEQNQLCGQAASFSRWTPIT